MANNKKINTAKKAETIAAKNINEETVAALRRLAEALKGLDDTGQNEITTDNIGISIRFWRFIPQEVDHAYKMMNDGAEIVKVSSTKYTLIGKINVDDGSKLSTELRQGCELISTAAFLIHQPCMGCSRSSRYFVKQYARAVVTTVLTLIQSFISLRAIDGNTGAQLTGAVWSACDKIIGKLPKGNRASMRRELFTWSGECNETIQEFQDLINCVSTEEGDDTKPWDKFCSNHGTGEGYTNLEKPIVAACISMIKCSRGIINLAINSLEYAGEEVTKLSQAQYGIEDEENIRRLLILQWMSNLHETCRQIGEGATDLGYLLYPPLNLSIQPEKDAPLSTELGQQILKQKDLLLSAAYSIDGGLPAGKGQQEIQMSDDVKEMCCRLISAISNRSSEAEQSIISAL